MSVIFVYSSDFISVELLMMATAQVSRKRKAYSILEKLQVVERIRKGETQTKVSREVGICF